MSSLVEKIRSGNRKVVAIVTSLSAQDYFEIGNTAKLTTEILPVRINAD